MPAIACLGFVSLGLPDGLLGLAWPSIRTALALPLDGLATVLFSSMVGYLASSFSSGTVAARHGLGGLLVASTVLVVASLLTFAAATALCMLALAGVLGGLGAGAIDAGINAYAARSFSARVTNWLHACYGLGAATGPTLVTALLVLEISWRVSYAMLAGALLLMALLFVSTASLWATPSGILDRNGRGADGVIRPKSVLPPSGRKAMWVNLSLFFVYTGAEATAAQWTYSLLTMGRNLPMAFAGTCVGAFWVALTLGRIGFGLVATRVAPERLLRRVVLAAPVAALLVAVDGGKLTAALGVALLGFTLAPIFPLMISLTPSRIGPAAANHAVGYQIALAYLGAAALPASAGVVAARTGADSLGWFLVSVTLILALIHELGIQGRRGASATDDL